jgi:desulfoferrodoxin-like iron-binding protein
MAQYYKCRKCDAHAKVIKPGKGVLACCGTDMELVTTFKSSDDILDFAIIKEQEAYDFYSEWADKMENKWIQEVFKDFAREELKHKDMLSRVKQGGTLKPSEKKITDLKIADYLIDLAPAPDMDFQKALIIAMKREKASYKFYSDLAQAVTDMDLRDTFVALSQEEAKHKLRLETIYEKEVLVWD